MARDGDVNAAKLVRACEFEELLSEKAAPGEN